MERSQPRLPAWLVAATHAGLDLLFPPLCAGCERTGAHFCPTCAQAVEPLGHCICAQCGKPQAHPVFQCGDCQQNPSLLRLIRAATNHSGPLRHGIHSLKYANRPELAVPLARYLTVTFAQPPWPSIHAILDGVVPVPMHPARLAERGYNQAERLAGAFCRQVHLPLQTDWLQRQRATESQVSLNRQQRRQNVAGAFIASAAVRNKIILLIDDVYTTGATFHACAAAAHAAGASAVYALALAAPLQVHF
ncbi:MAG: ComF family protein [Chloroflexota bacterium]|nr:ComF family protein [Chloroflexota bacterium]